MLRLSSVNESGYWLLHSLRNGGNADAGVLVAGLTPTIQITATPVRMPVDRVIMNLLCLNMAWNRMRISPLFGLLA